MSPIISGSCNICASLCAELPHLPLVSLSWHNFNMRLFSCCLLTVSIQHKTTYTVGGILFSTVVVKVHRSSTWVKVQIRILKYYSSKSKSTAFSILLEWKYKSTQFFMYLSKKVLIDRFILQFYIDYFIKFYISTYFYNPTAQNTWVFPK